MMVFGDVTRIPPSMFPLSKDEQTKLLTERLEAENRWVAEFIRRLHELDRETKH